MSTTTANLGLFKYNTTTDANVAFNINTALNQNWDIIDNAITHVDGLPDQTDKAGYLLTTNGSEASWGETAEIHCVVETFVDETSWYRVWSDGWCEQGGYLSWSGDWTTVSLLKEYKNTNYITIAGGYRTDGSPYQCMISFKNWTRSSFEIWSSDDTTYNPCICKWQASGYIEV